MAQHMHVATSAVLRGVPVRALCREYAGEQVALQKADFIRLGVLGDWDNPYLTMNFANEAGEIRALGRLVEPGVVFKGLKPVNWCFDCGSALAEAEDVAAKAAKAAAATVRPAARIITLATTFATRSATCPSAATTMVIPI